MRRGRNSGKQALWEVQREMKSMQQLDREVLFDKRGGGGRGGGTMGGKDHD